MYPVFQDLAQHSTLLMLHEHVKQHMQMNNLVSINFDGLRFTSVLKQGKAMPSIKPSQQINMQNKGN